MVAVVGWRGLDCCEGCDVAYCFMLGVVMDLISSLLIDWIDGLVDVQGVGSSYS